MHDQAFQILEYDQILDLIRRGAQTQMGQAQLSHLVPLTDRIELMSALSSVGECVRLRQRGSIWSFSELADPEDALSRLQIEGAVLDPADILVVARLCDAAMSARATILSEREDAPVLWRIVEQLPRDLSSLTARIANKILPSGELDDRASPELARIRHDIAKMRSTITRALETLMRKSEAAVQDELVTVRNDRFVIPIKSDHRARIQGVAHGFSSSGATAFIEPMETVEANNELQTLREEEQREIHRILFGLTEGLRQNLPSISQAARAVAELDFINSKAVFHERFDCVIPQIDETVEAVLELTAARHPLLEENLRPTGDSVVPVTFRLDPQHDSMVISGANAGGKTVVLKTTGLLSLMALSGVPVPAQNASIPFYKVVLADIGDHQSLAANLSTFTSHVANISRMLELCESPALVLLDEVGTGTDPEEGSALGVAVVDHFRRVCGAQVLATTHYSGLKMYAANEEGILNASVEFDDKTLRPTYRLIVGVAGASSGLEIARRFGVPDAIVNKALSQVDESSRRSGEYLQRIKREADEAFLLRQALEEERAAVAEKFMTLERDAQKRELEREEIFRSQLEEARHEFEKRSKELVAAIQDRAERLKLEREAQQRSAEFRREVSRASQVVKSASGSTTANESRAVRVVRHGREMSVADRPAEELDKTFTVSTARDIKPGDHVRLRTFGSIGIVDEIKNGEAEIRVKSVRMREKLENLDLVEAAVKKTTQSRFTKLRPREKTEVSLAGTEPARVELNVIGKTTVEATDNLDKFLDEAFMSGATEVRVIHGHGTGALRAAVGNLLKAHPHVERFAPAPQNQGGGGATVVWLKQ